MYKKILCLGILFVSLTTKAHQTDISTTMLVEKENNIWVLQISSSLSAFQQEIRTHFADTPYDSPEAFQQMVLEHIKNNFELRFNGSETVSLHHGFVQLGHETKVVFKVEGVPSHIRSLEVKNNAFADIHRSKSVVAIVKNGFKKVRFVLDDSNKHSLSLVVADNEFKEKSTSEASFLSYHNAFILLGIMGLGFLVKKGIAVRTKKNA